MASITIYNETNIDQLDWKDTHQGESAERYFAPLVKNGIGRYVNNIQAKTALLKIDNFLFPLLIASDNYDDSYVCSPYGHYILLALESLFLVKNQFMRRAAQFGLCRFGQILRKSGLNRTVYVNHWLFSTDLHPNDLASDQISCLTTFLKKEFPKHAIIFRSINPLACSPLKKTLKRQGFQFIAGRQIHMTDVKNPDLFKTRIIKSDLKLWKEHDYEVVDQKQLTADDDARILELYSLLSIKHHSSLNPQFNINFISLFKQHPLFQLKALKKNGQIEAVVGYANYNRTLICSFIGYNKDHPEKTRLYRLLSTMLLLEAKQQADVFHQSAGASFYKKIRRAQSSIEYQGVYLSHLPYKQRFAWHLLRQVMNNAAIHFMEKY